MTTQKSAPAQHERSDAAGSATVPASSVGSTTDLLPGYLLRMEAGVVADERDALLRECHSFLDNLETIRNHGGSPLKIDFEADQLVKKLAAALSERGAAK